MDPHYSPDTPTSRTQQTIIQSRLRAVTFALFAQGHTLCNFRRTQSRPFLLGGMFKFFNNEETSGMLVLKNYICLFTSLLGWSTG